jgi:hypothetical protein
MSWPTRAQLSLHPSRSLHSAPLPLYPSWLPQIAILHLRHQPDAQVHPELQLQGDGHKAQIIIILILLPVTIPCLSSASLQDGSYQPGQVYHTTHGDRLNFAAARAAWGIEGQWGALQLAARQGTLSELFPDLGESSYENWDFKQADVLMAFLNQQMLAAPDETRHIWKLDDPLEDVPNDEVPSMAWLHMAHTGPLPPIWDLLYLQPSAETLHLLSLVEFTDLLNGCAPELSCGTPS